MLRSSMQNRNTIWVEYIFEYKDAVYNAVEKRSPDYERPNIVRHRNTTQKEVRFIFF